MTEQELCDVLARNVKSRREELDLTQTQLGEAARLPQSVISRIEKGDICIAYGKIAPLATALRTTPAALQSAENVFAGA